MKIFILVTTFLAGIMASFFVGVKVGGAVLFGEDAPYRAVFAAGALTHMKEGRPESAEKILESYIDTSVYSYVTFSNQYLSWMFPEAGDKIEQKNAMAFVSKYRKKYPYVYMGKSSLGALSSSERESISEYDEIVESALAKYEVAPHNTSLKADVPDGPRP